MSVKAIINFRWGPAKSFVLLRQMMPYSVFFAFYLIYVLFILDKHKDLMTSDHLEEHDFPLWFKMLDNFWLIVLTLFSIFFLRQEYRQVKLRKWSYLKDVWNYADFVPPCIILLLVAVDVFSHEYTQKLLKLRYGLEAVASLLMWLKIFYFLRIFRRTGFFVNMLIKVFFGIAIFLALYILILCAFTSSFYIMANDGNGFIYQLNYTYLLGLGEFDMEWDSNFVTPKMAHLTFLVATLLILIVMLNLLIAIVS